MRTIDEEDYASRAKLSHLAFEDYLEAICRIAGILALPTDDELVQQGHSNAGEHRLLMKVCRSLGLTCHEALMQILVGSWQDRLQTH